MHPLARGPCLRIVASHPCHSNKMYANTLALAFCLAVAPAFADQAATPRKPAADGFLQAALVLPAQAAQAQPGRPAGVLPANLQQPAKPVHAAPADADAPPPAQDRPVLAMLLAALAVMTGIVLRRWVGSER
jgi:hypothetical protein